MNTLIGNVYKVSNILHPTQKNDPNPLSYIPKNIFQTYSVNTLSKAAYEAVNSWRELNPTWTHHFFSSQERRAFIEEHFDHDILWAYDQLIPRAYQADLWRYCVLFIHGGVYADHKIILKRSLDAWLPCNIRMVLMKDALKKNTKHSHFQHKLWNGLLIAEPKHSFFETAIQKIAKQVKNGFYGQNPLSPTGPCLLGRSINQVLKREPLTPFEVGSFQQPYYYNIFPSPFIKSAFNPKLFGHEDIMSFYPEYCSERKMTTLNASDTLQADYSAAWFMGKVYLHGKRQQNIKHVYYKTHVFHYMKRKIRLALQSRETELAKKLIIWSLQQKSFQPRIWLFWIHYQIYTLFIDQIKKPK